MVGTGAGTFFAANRHLAIVEQITEEFPAGWRFKHAEPELFGHAVGGGAGRHGPRNALDAVLVAGGQMRIGGEHGKRIGWGDEDTAPDNEIAIAVAVGSRAKIRRMVGH